MYDLGSIGETLKWDLSNDHLIDKYNKSMVLMYKDVKIAKIEEMMIKDIYQKEYIPLELRNNKHPAALYMWIVSRAMKPERENYKLIMNHAGIEYSIHEDIILKTLALSLTDSYWIDIEENNRTWEEINLYENSFNEAISYLALTGKQYKLTIQLNSYTPEVCTQGVYAKCWRRESDGIYLYKRGRNKDEVIREIIASKILKSFGSIEVGVVDYSMDYIDNIEASKCKLLTNKDSNIVSAASLYTFSNINKINFFDIIKNNYNNQYRDMILMNAIINNNDLHLGNWGFYYDGKSIGRIHDLLDFNNAMNIEIEGNINYYGKYYSCLEISRTLIEENENYINNIKKIIDGLDKLKYDNTYVEYMYKRLNILIP